MSIYARFNPVAIKITAALSFCVAMAGMSVPSQAALSLSDSPLFLSVNVAPNIVMTLDDSGSMAWGYVPDGISGTAGTRRYASAHFNPQYYNPNVKYTIPTRHDGVVYTTSFNSARRNGFDSSRGTRDLRTQYRVTATYRNDETSDASQAINPAADYSTALQTSNVQAYYYKYVSTNAGCNGTKTDEDCYTRVLVDNNSGPATVDLDGNGVVGNVQDKDERQNFANWYSFYRTRALTTISGAMSAIGQVSDGTVRLAWQALNNTSATSCRGFGTTSPGTCRGYTSTTYDNRIRNLNSAHRTQFFDFLSRFSSESGTPLRTAMERAGQYYQRVGVNSPYAADPQVSVGTELSCRKNYHVMMTDGIWNDTVTAYGNADNTTTTLGDGVSSYTPQAPYRDTQNSDSLADIAFFYWHSDLRGDLSNNVAPYMPDQSGTTTQKFWNAKNNPATWQNMVNFTVGLGLSGTLTNPAWAGSTYTGDYPNLVSGAVLWPNTGANATGNVADLWHAAINSRGQFFSAESPDDLGNAFKVILNSILTANPSAAALAANSTSLQSGTLIYQASFDSSDWSGRFKALPVQGDGSVGAALWDAATLLPAHASRNILSHNGTSPITFNWTNLSAAQKTALNADGFGTVDSRGSDRLSWLRGDTSKEVRFYNATTNPTATFRNRVATVLGDTINSDPAFVKSEDYGYTSLPLGALGQSTYAAFVTGKSTRPPMIYVGANDGMLHGFRSDTGAADSGREIFAYVPAAVYDNLSKLTSQSYIHKPFVDGSPSAGDAYINGAWKTVLLGSLGGGGKAVFALDITNPFAMSTGQVLWEFQDAADLGFTLAQAQIARLNNGVWAAIFANGYNSFNDRAYLYIVNLETGALIKKIPAGASTSNGLSTPVLYDDNGDKTVDAIYAGDLQGNMWKFDLNGSTVAAWGVANSGLPLFTARNASAQVQPITSQPRIGAHPNSGVLVHFGTGRYLVASDTSSTEVQSYYAIWDNGTPVTTTNRSELQAQTIVAETIEFGKAVRETSANTVNWAGGMRGWYLDLLPPLGTGGERITVRPLLLYDRTLFVTRKPSTDQCSPGGESWIMQLKADTGARYSSPLFDLNNDDKFTAPMPGGDTLASGNQASGIKTTVGIASTPVFLTGTGGGYGGASGEVGGLGTPVGNYSTTSPTSPSPDYGIVSGTSGATETFKLAPSPVPPPPPPCVGAGCGVPARVYWQQIL